MQSEKLVGIEIKRIREIHGLKQADFAKKIGVSVKALQNWENEISDPGVQSIRAIMSNFHVSANELFGEENNEVSIIIPADIPEKEQKFLHQACMHMIQLYHDHITHAPA